MSRGSPAPVARLAILAAVLGALGCALFRPESLEIPPNHAAVLGRVEVAGFGFGDASVRIMREDGNFEYTLPVSRAPAADFAIVLPRGRYRIVEFLALREGNGDQVVWPLRLGFDTGADPAVYVGTLRLSGGLGLRQQISVLDQHEATVRALRRLYTDLPDPVVRLMTGA
jgi:hypothetical protein